MVAQVAERYADGMRPEFPHRFFDLRQVVVGEHQVDDLHFVPVVIEVPGNVGHTDGHRLGTHATVEPVLPVGGDEKDTHCYLP